jgi:hypothetical protein
MSFLLLMVESWLFHMTLPVFCYYIGLVQQAIHFQPITGRLPIVILRRLITTDPPSAVTVYTLSAGVTRRGTSELNLFLICLQLNEAEEFPGFVKKGRRVSAPASA